MPDTAFPADPYPGIAPGWSFVHLDTTSRPLAPDPAATAGWRLTGGSGASGSAVDDDGPRAGGPHDGGPDLDDWLAARGAPPLAERVPVLAFGSNRCPEKITWLRSALGLRGPAVVLRAEVDDLAAIWASGLRTRDGARPATLAHAPGAREVHAVWMATPEQVAVLDVCEGRGERYHLARLRVGTVRTEDGAALDGVWTYWPASAQRAPLLVDGAPVRCAELTQSAARALTGETGPLDTTSAVPETGAPDPRAWPSRLFVYGTLAPGRSAWRLLSGHVDPTAGAPVEAWMPGRVYDTGRGYPALRLRPGGTTRALGTVVTLRDPAAAMPALDAYEGPEYRRVRSLTYSPASASATPCWVWVWNGPVDGWPAVDRPWGT